MIYYLRLSALILGAVLSSFLWTTFSILTAFILFEIQMKLEMGKIQEKDIPSFLMSSQGKLALLSIFYSLTCELLIVVLILLVLKQLKALKRSWFSNVDIFLFNCNLTYRPNFFNLLCSWSEVFYKYY